MRKVIYGGASSLDGFFAGPDGAIDWLHFSKDVEAVIAQSWASADTLLFGRKTWEVSTQLRGGSGGPAGVTSFVFSRTLDRVSGTGVTLVREEAGAFVASLKARPGKDILVMGGGLLGRSLLAAGVIDEIGLNIHPVLLGSGVPAFLDAGVRVRLALAECRTLDGGCVLVRYLVRH